MSELLPVSRIRTDGATQPRAYVDATVVEDYAELMGRGVQFPPVTVFYDGQDHWLAGGFHRFYAVRDGLEATTIEAEVRMGTRRDAVLFSVGENAEHGMRRTREDMRRAVLKLIEDDEWKGWSDGEIARRCAVSEPFVQSLRPVSLEGASSEDALRTYRNKHGSVSVMDTSRITEANKARASGVREAKMSTPELALEQSIRAVALTMRSWPTAVRAAAITRAVVSRDDCERFSAWWNDFGEEMDEPGKWRSA